MNANEPADTIPSRTDAAASGTNFVPPFHVIATSTPTAGVGLVDPHRADGAESDAAGAHGCAEQRPPVVVRQLRDPTARASSALFIFERPSMPFSLASS